MVTRQKVNGRVKPAASQTAGASRKSATDEALTADKRAQSEEGRRAAENLKRRALDTWEDEGGSLAGTRSVVEEGVEKARKS